MRIPRESDWFFFFNKISTGLGKYRVLSGYKQNLVHIRIQEKGTSDLTLDWARLALCIWESAAEVWVYGGLSCGQRHWQHSGRFLVCWHNGGGRHIPTIVWPQAKRWSRELLLPHPPAEHLIKDLLILGLANIFPQPVPPTVKHDVSLLFTSIRGHTEWKLQSQININNNHLKK